MNKILASHFSGVYLPATSLLGNGQRLAMAAIAVWVWALPNVDCVSAAPIEWQLDPVTGQAVAQLTEWDTTSTADTQDNSALYYHQPNQSEDGHFLIYQHKECRCTSSCGTSGSSVSYRRLDLETGEEEQLFGTGLANGAVVQDDHLYVVTRDSVQNAYDRIEKIHLETLAVTCLTQLPSNHQFTGALTVNADASWVIYQTVPNGQSGGGVTWGHNPDPSVANPCQLSHSDLELHGYDSGIEHVQFSLSDPEVFTFIDQHSTKLARVGVGTVNSSGSTWNNLASDQDYFDLFYGLPHPFWDADGHLWSDIIGPSSSTNLEEAFVRFTLDEETGWVQNFAYSEMDLDDWHHHQAGNRSLGWFVGDGENDVSRPNAGVPFISLFRVDPSSSPGGSMERHELAGSLGAANSGTGTNGANAHLLETLDGVVWAAPYDLGAGESADYLSCPASRNVFLVKIPPRLKARLDDTVIGGSANGPFKHASRLSVTGGGASWAVDYGKERQGVQAPTLGNGVTDRTAGAISSSSDHVGLADIDGDDVDDRLAFTQIAGGWRVELASTPYDGVLPTGSVTPDSSRDFAMTFSFAPFFGDLNGDGRDDMVRLENNGTQLLWQGHFSADDDLPASPYVSLGLNWETPSAFGDAALDEHFFVADVNGDGFGDRILVRPMFGGWQWLLDLGTSTGFGDSVVDSSFIGASNATDIPLVADVDADGRADIAIARPQGQLLRWFVNTSENGGFGSSWNPPVGVGSFGAIGQPLIGNFGRFHTVEP